MKSPVESVLLAASLLLSSTYHYVINHTIEHDPAGSRFTEGDPHATFLLSVEKVAPIFLGLLLGVLAEEAGRKLAAFQQEMLPPAQALRGERLKPA
jgi:hypothetical protein